MCFLIMQHVSTFIGQFIQFQSDVKIVVPFLKSMLNFGIKTKFQIAQNLVFMICFLIFRQHDIWDFCRQLTI